MSNGADRFLDRLNKTQERALTAVVDKVLSCLPSSYMPMEITVEEAIDIGKQLFPHWVLVRVQNPSKCEDLECLLEMMGRGFLFSAVHSLPEWLRCVWIYKTEIKNEQQLLSEVTPLIMNTPDAEKLAAQWIWLACGWPEDEVICEYMNRIDVTPGTTVDVPADLMHRLDVLGDE